MKTEENICWITQKVPPTRTLKADQRDKYEKNKAVHKVQTSVMLKYKRAVIEVPRPHLFGWSC